jgi:hypothetical protein
VRAAAGGGNGRERALREGDAGAVPSGGDRYDQFHVVAKFGRKVVDRVQVAATDRLARARAQATRRRISYG